MMPCDDLTCPTCYGGHDLDIDYMPEKRNPDDNWLVHLIKGAMAFGINKQFEKELDELTTNGDHIGTEMWHCLNDMYCDFLDQADLDGWRTFIHWIDDGILPDMDTSVELID